MEKELILKIMKTALEINSRERNTIFITYYGHINSLTVQIHTKGWEKNKYPDYSKDIYMNNMNLEQNKK